MKYLHCPLLWFEVRIRTSWILTKKKIFDFETYMLHTLYYDMRYNQINVFSKVIIEMYEWHKNDNMNVKWYILTLLFLNLWSLIDVNMNYFIIDIMTNKWHLKNLESGIKSVPEHIRFDWQLDFNIVCSCLYKFI